MIYHSFEKTEKRFVRDGFVNLKSETYGKINQIMFTCRA